MSAFAEFATYFELPGVKQIDPPGEMGKAAPSAFLEMITKGNRPEFVKAAIEYGAKNTNWAAYYAAKKGHIQLFAALLMYSEIDWELAAIGAAKGGQMGIMRYCEYMISEKIARATGAEQLQPELTVDYFRKRGVDA